MARYYSPDLSLVFVGWSHYADLSTGRAWLCEDELRKFFHLSGARRIRVYSSHTRQKDTYRLEHVETFAFATINAVHVEDHGYNEVCGAFGEWVKQEIEKGRSYFGIEIYKEKR